MPSILAAEIITSVHSNEKEKERLTVIRAQFDEVLIVSQAVQNCQDALVAYIIALQAQGHHSNIHN